MWAVNIRRSYFIYYFRQSYPTLVAEPLRLPLANGFVEFRIVFVFRLGRIAEKETAKVPTPSRWPFASNWKCHDFHLFFSWVNCRVTSDFSSDYWRWIGMIGLVHPAVTILADKPLWLPFSDGLVEFRVVILIDTCRIIQKFISPAVPSHRPYTSDRKCEKFHFDFRRRNFAYMNR